MSSLFTHFQRKSLRSIVIKNGYHKWPANKIRSTFLSFYKDLDHHHVASSPVVPWNDSSLEFVNAGMNQFKPVLLGKKIPSFNKAVNSQKCIRVGGKHNDLEEVGLDTYHHTFFEMLGSWSFNDYFKKEACAMAWKLLIEEFKIPQELLYVTYFGGDVESGLSPDTEVKEIWKSLGVPPDRIFPLGLKDNFWEMGSSGPCGPCTEIHFRYLPEENIANGGKEFIDMELWNLVFVQYERLPAGNLVALKHHNVDTGMGLERLAAFLNGKTSNYDTDLFIPLFNCLEKLSDGVPPYRGSFSRDESNIDVSYRIIADHSRMMTVALSDGLLPHDSYVLRKIIRRSLRLGQETLGLASCPNFLGKLSMCCGEILGNAYPEILEKMDTIVNLLAYEEEKYKETQMQVSREWNLLVRREPDLRSLVNISSNLVDGLKAILARLQEWRAGKSGPISLEDLVDWSKRYKVQQEFLRDLFDVLKLPLDLEGMVSLREQIEGKTSSVSAQSVDVCTTDEQEVYGGGTYSSKDSENKIYEFPLHSTTILAILKDGVTCEQACAGDKVTLALQSTSMHPAGSGQLSDRGTVTGKDGIFEVEKVRKVGGNILHSGKVTAGKINCGDSVEIALDGCNRLALYRGHTACHLMLAALEAVNGMSYQRKFHITTAQNLVLQVFTYPPLDLQQVKHAEKIVQEWIRQGSSIEERVMFLADALKLKPKMVSGKLYTDVVQSVTSSCLLPEDLLVWRKDDQDKNADKKSLSGSSPDTANTNEIMFEKDDTLKESFSQSKDNSKVSVQQVNLSDLSCGMHVHNTEELGGFTITDFKLNPSSGVTEITAVIGSEGLRLVENGISLENELLEWEKRVNDAMERNLKVKGLEKELRKWRAAIEECNYPATLIQETNLRVDSLLKRMASVLKADSNYAVLKQELEDVSLNHRNEAFVHIAVSDFRGSQANLASTLEPYHTHPVAVICKGWGRVRIAVFIPEAFSVCLDSMFSDVESFIGRQCQISVNPLPNKEGQVGTLVLAGVKRDQLEQIMSGMKKLCEKYMIPS